MALTFDYSKLRGRIIEKCGSLTNFSMQSGIPSSTTSLLLNNRAKWNQETITKTINVLDIEVGDIPIYFFAPKVQNT